MAQNVVLAKVEMAFVPAEVVTTVHVNSADFFSCSGLGMEVMKMMLI